MNKNEMKSVIATYLEQKHNHGFIKVLDVQNFIDIYINTKAGNVEKIKLVKDDYCKLLNETIWDLVIERKLSPSPLDVGTFFTKDKDSLIVELKLKK